MKELQRRLGGLTADGIVGRNTWAKLNRYGTAIGWVAGGTLYVCRRNSSELYFSLRNNTGKNAAWEYKFAGGTYALNGTVNNSVKRFLFDSSRASFDSRKLGIWVGTVSREDYRSTTKVRDFRRSSLRICA